MIPPPRPMALAPEPTGLKEDGISPMVYAANAESESAGFPHMSANKNNT